eukprot:SAG11_NODE_991_length_6262_cov_12.112607_2_plen_84_part_00
MRGWRCAGTLGGIEHQIFLVPTGETCNESPHLLALRVAYADQSQSNLRGCNEHPISPCPYAPVPFVPHMVLYICLSLRRRRET